MRFLALAIALSTGPTVSLGIGEFEKQIGAAETIEDKISLAEEGFKSIEGFVPRELFMSYWSIDALGAIASRYESILDSKGIEGLIPEYSHITRICAMEMGDYRYFFEPLKTELDALLVESYASNNILEYFTLRNKAIRKDLLSSWSVASIRSLINFWILSGEAEEPSDFEDMLRKRWSVSDIEYWDLVFSQLRLSPNQIVKAMNVKLRISNSNSLGLPYSLVDSITDEDSLWWVPEITQIKSEVSIGGPRLD